MLIDVKYYDDIEGIKNKDRKIKKFSVKRITPLDIKESEPGELLAIKFNHIDDNKLLAQEYREIDGKLMTPYLSKNKLPANQCLYDNLKEFENFIFNKKLYINKGLYINKDKEPIKLFSKSNPQFCHLIDCDELKHIEQSNHQYKLKLINSYSEHLRSVNGYLWIETLGPLLTLNNGKPHYILETSKTPEMMKYELNTKYKNGLPIGFSGGIKVDKDIEDHNIFYDETIILNLEKFKSFSKPYEAELLFNNIFGLNILKELEENTCNKVSYENYIEHLFKYNKIGIEIEFLYKNYEEDKSIQNLELLLTFISNHLGDFNREYNNFTNKNTGSRYGDPFKSDYDLMLPSQFLLKTLKNLNQEFNIITHNYNGNFAINTKEHILKLKL